LNLDIFFFSIGNRTWIAVIARYGGCTFEEKVRNAMNANYSAAIVYNVDSNKVIQMGGADDTLIPSVFIGYTAGKDILTHFAFNVNPKFRVIVTDDEPFDINAYLLPFAIVVGICFVIMLAIVLFKCFQDRRRRMRHRLPKSALKKLPIHKFKNGDPFETCCICLDDFEEGEKLRILPCDHGYHSKCIDSWLVKHKRICPQCRKRVFDRGTPGYSSDSEDNTERAPLLGARGRSSTSASSGPGGTFGSGPSTSGILQRLQSQPATGPTGSASVLQHRRFRRPRRLRRVYEVLNESTTSSNDDEASDADENDETFVQTEHETTVSSQGSPRQTEVSAEVHVQVYDDNVTGAVLEAESHPGPDLDGAEPPPVVVASSRSPNENQDAGSENV